MLAVRVPEISSHPWLLLDIDDGTLLGRVADVVDSLDADFLAETVYHPVRNSWLQIWRDGSRWREISLTDGRVIGEGSPADTIPERFTKIPPEMVPQGRREMIGGVFWDPEVESVRLLLRPKSADNGRTSTINSCSVEQAYFSGSTPTMFDFDPAVGEFVHSDSTLERISILPPQLGRLQLRERWAFRQSTSFAAHSRSPTVIQRECVARTAQPAATPEPPPVLREIIAVANVDEVFDPSLPSIFPGGTIELVGENLTAGTMIAFEIDSRVLRGGDGDNREIGIEEFGVTEVSNDRTAPKVRVPSDAISGTVRIAGQPEGVELQIVPRIATGGRLRGDVAAAERMLKTYTIFGIGSTDAFSILIDDQVFLGCSLPLSAGCKPATEFEDVPIIQHSLEVITLTGRHRVELPTPEPAERPWLIEGVDDLHPHFAAEYAYTGLTPNTFLAGSHFFVQVGTSDSSVTQSLPEELNFLLRSDPKSNRPSDFDRIRSIRNEDGLYPVALPIDFRGGTLEIEPPLGAEGAPPDEILQIEIAPTVIGASGDSAAAGSTILLSGNELSDAVFTIDDVVVTPQATPPFEELGLDTLALVVPDEVTVGELSITKDGVTATLDRLVPWWPETAMPTAEVGQATYASLPSANSHQRIEYFIDCLPNEHYDCQSEEGLPFSIIARALTANGFNRSVHQKIVELIPNSRLRVQPQVNVRGPVMLFGDRSGRSLNLLPIVPEAAVRTYSAEVGINSGSTEGWLELDTDNVITRDGIEIRWDDQQWTASTFDLYRLSLPGDPNLERASRLGPTDDSLIRSWPDRFDRNDAVLHSSIWLGRDNLEELLSGPIEVGNGWGTHTVDYGEPVTAIDQILSELVATSGTPADPSLPSVNAGQQLVVPQEIFDFQDGIFFAKRNDPSSDDPSRRANWTAAAKQIERHDEFEDDQYHVPFDAVTGMMRWGLFGTERHIQVVPTIRVQATTWTPLPFLHMSMQGVDEGDQLRFGDFSVTLSPDEVRSGRFVYSADDPRLAGITADALAGGISLVGSGGQSEVVLMPAVTGLLINGLPPEQVDGPIRVRPGDEITLIGENFNTDSRAHLEDLEDNFRTSAAIELVGIADDGKSAILRVSESSDPYSLWQLQFEVRLGLAREAATWSLPERRLLILPSG